MTTDIPTPEGSRLIRASAVQNTSVKNMEGERLGTVEDLVLDRLDGRVLYVVLRHDSILGFGGKLYPLPWAILRYRPEEDAYVVGLDKSYFEDGGFPPDDWPDHWPSGRADATAPEAAADVEAPEFALPAETPQRS